MGKDYIIAAENRIPYIYSTKQYRPNAEIQYPEWKGKFDSSMDLLFGIGHSIQTEEEFERISEIVQINLFLKEDYTYYDSKETVISQGIDEIKYP